MNMAEKQPAYSVLQYSSEPAGGRRRLDAAWVGRIRSTTEKSEGCRCACSMLIAKVGLSY